MTLAERIVESLFHDIDVRVDSVTAWYADFETNPERAGIKSDWTTIVERKIREATGVR